MKRLVLSLSILMVLSMLVGGCAPADTKTLILATTTSTQDSGLLDVLVSLFEKQSGYTVQTVAMGTGEALKMGEQGNADVLLVHAPSSEATFMDNGSGRDRWLVMHNDFILVGPAADPAGLKGLKPQDALKTAFNSAAPFVTRADDSGTYKKEVSLWKAAGLEPKGAAWYIETGQGMGASLIVASEKGAYILTDRATYLANQANLQLDLLVEGDNSLLNVYHVITVNPDKWPKINYKGALAFAKFITSDEIQSIIAGFGVDKYGQPLFYPDAGRPESDLGL